MRQKFLLLFVLLAAAMLLPAAQTMKTGSRITHLPSPLYLDNSTHSLSEFQNKKYLVLFIFENNAAALQEFPKINTLFKQWDSLAAFVGVGIGSAEKLRSLPGAASLPFPVNIDKGTVKKSLFRKGDRAPLAVLLDKNGTLLWRGKAAGLSRIIRNCEAGKFDINEQLRLEIFNDAVNEAIKNNKLDKAVKLLDTEYRRNPGKIFLLSLQVKLLKRLNRTQDIFKILHDAQKKSPADHRIFEMEYQLIGETADDKRRPEFFTRLKNNFARSPYVLLGVAIAELQMPSGHLELATVTDLVESGWRSNAFSSSAARGAYALEYARILHSLGRNDLALIMAETACKDLAKEPKAFAKAEAALIYYRKLSNFAPLIKLPNLKN